MFSILFRTGKTYVRDLFSHKNLKAVYDSIVADVLHVSVRSLQRYRSLGILPYKMMHKKAYYTKEGVLQFLNSNVVSYNREEVALYFAKLGMSA